MGPVKYNSNEVYLLKGMGIDVKNMSNLKKEWQTAKDIFDALNKLGPNPAAYRKLFAHAKILLKQDNPRFGLIQLVKKRMNQIEEKSKYEDFEIKTTALVNTNTIEPVTLDEAQILKIYKIIHAKDQDLAILAQFYAKKVEELVKKIRRRHPVLNDPKYLQGLKIAAFLVIYKASRDNLFDNYTIAQIFELSLQQLNKIELQFLKSIDFNLDLTQKN